MEHTEGVKLTRKHWECAGITDKDTRSIWQSSFRIAARKRASVACPWPRSDWRIIPLDKIR